MVKQILKYDYLVLLAACLLLPVQMNMVPVLLLLFSVMQVIRIATGIVAEIQWRKTLVLLSAFWLFYLLHVIGMLWTTNISDGMFNLEVKLSFLFLPFIVYVFGYNRINEIRKVLWGFVFGVALAGAIFLAKAAYIYCFEDSWIQHFFGSRFCFTMHVGYYAIYLNIAALIVFFESKRQWMQLNRTARFGRIIISVFIFLLLILTSAKNPIVTYLILALIIIGVYYFRKNTLKGIALLLLVTGVFTLVVLNSEKTYLRFKALYNNTFNTEFLPESTESTQVRTAAWLASVEVMKENILVGVGTGDDNDALDNMFETKGFTGAIERKMNSHNAVLEIGVKLGVLGVLAVLGVLLFPIAEGVRKRNALLALGGIVFLIASATESIFEVQAGVMAFCLFIPLFIMYNQVMPNNEFD